MSLLLGADHWSVTTGGKINYTYRYMQQVNNIHKLSLMHPYNDINIYYYYIYFYYVRAVKECTATVKWQRSMVEYSGIRAIIYTLMVG